MLDLCEFISCVPVPDMSHYYFPQEILEEILLRLPLKSLVNCISVCKSWKSLISNHSFICNQLNRTIQANPDIASLFLFISLKKRAEGFKYYKSQDFYSLCSDNHQQSDDNELMTSRSVLKSSFIPLFTSEHKEVVGTCNGLVCLADYSVLDTSDLVIWNPCIQKYLVLPKPSLRFRFCDPDHRRNRVFFGFGFDSEAKDFKVVRLVSTRVSLPIVAEDSLAVVHTYCSEVDEEFISIWVMLKDSWSEAFHCDTRRYGGISNVLAIRNCGELVLRIYGGIMILLDLVKESVKDLGPRDFVHAFAGFHVESLFLINEQRGVLSY